MTFQVQVVEKIGGKEIHQIRLANKQGVSVSFLTLGATWQEFLVPQANGVFKNLLLGFEKPSDYQANSLFAGQTIGRTAGRIAKGQARIEGKDYQLPINNNANTLHGGPRGFHAQIWSFETVKTDQGPQLILTYNAKEAIDGFPGDLSVTLKVTLTEANEVIFNFNGSKASQTTLFNPTTHPYFNLSQYQDLHSHTLTVQADRVLEVDEELIPSGRWLDVTGTAYDFRTGQNLSTAVSQNEGFDDAWVVNGQSGEPIVILTDEESGDQLSIFSERQGVVIYTMNTLEDGVFFARDKGVLGQAFEGVAIEPQDLPDAVNHEQFNQVFLEPEEEKTYDITFVYENVK